MQTDRFGNSFTGGCPDTVRAIDRYTDSFLAYGTQLPVIFEAADANPDCAGAQAHAAAVHMALEAARGFRNAYPYLARAKALALQASEREASFIRAVEAWAKRDYGRVVRLLTEHAVRWPEDIAAAKWGQYHAFNLGDNDAMLAIAEAILPAHRGGAYMHGMHAFGLEQCHRLEEAEEAGRLAVEIERADPWAHHAVAHVMETQGRVSEGLTWMTDLSETWADKGVFIRHHNWWHVALFQMDRDDHKGALETFDRALWGVLPDFGQEQIGAVSALWRLEMRGVDVGERWAPVVEEVRAREFEHVQPFHDLHYVYALARAGSPAEAELFLVSMSAHGDRQPAELAAIWREVAVPVGRGIVAHGQRRYEEAAELLRPALRQVHRIGGSHAQRDIFHQAYLDALMRAGHYDKAAELLECRCADRRGIPHTERLLAAVREGCCEAALAVG